MNNTLKVIITSILFASCEGNSENVGIPDDFSSERIISKQNQLQQILTKEMVAQAVNVPVEKIEVSIENSISRNGQYAALYSWATGNKKKIADGKYEIDEYHSVSIGFVRQMKADAFEQYYGTNAGIQIQVDEMAKQEHFNKETGTIEAKYLAEYASSRKTEKLEDVATMAFWETPMNALHVLAKDAAFTVTANFGDNEKLARKHALAILQIMLTN